MTAYCQIIDLLSSVSPLRQNNRILLFVLHAFNKSVEHTVNVSVVFFSLFIIFLNFHLSSWPGPLLYLLVLTPHSKPVDVHRDGDHDFGISHRFS